MDLATSEGVGVGFRNWLLLKSTILRTNASWGGGGGETQCMTDGSVDILAATCCCLILDQRVTRAKDVAVPTRSKDQNMP